MVIRKRLARHRGQTQHIAADLARSSRDGPIGGSARGARAPRDASSAACRAARPSACRPQRSALARRSRSAADLADACQPPRTGSARVGTASRTPAAFRGHRQHVTLLRFVAPDLGRRHAAFLDRHRGRSKRAAGRRRGRAPATRSTGRRRRRRGSTGSGSPRPAPSSDRCTSCARRCISGLPRCTESKSSSAVLVPAPMLEAAPPPRPMRMPGPPSWISSVPGGRSSLSRLRARRALPMPPAIMIGL